MRTTLNIDDDVLQAIKELARLRGSTAGEVLSALAREALGAQPSTAATRNGVPLLEPVVDAGIVSSEHVADLLDEA
ncbi:MAG TPA: CopG family transcriptional regulator [Longimicrobiales bacterium]|nr:CopG family transcriptional regulator [Longimicrobiales bacterium]